MRQNTKNSREVLNTAVELCKGQLHAFYQPEWTWKKTEDGDLKLNAFSFAALNFLRIHTALIQTYEDLSQIDVPLRLQRYSGISDGHVFLKGNRNRIFGDLDSFLMEAFLPRWQKLTAVDLSILNRK